MKKLNPPNIPEPQTHLAVLTARREADAEQIAELLARRFAQYDDATPALRDLPEAEPELVRHRGMLRNLYDSETAAATTVLDSVLALETKRCPYCGRPGRPGTIDHFLARSQYGEFSLYVKNLVPSCWACNHAKLAQAWDATGNRLFLNPYFDDFMAERFVMLRVTPDPVDGFNVPLFEFDFEHEGMTDASRRTCASHFQELGISSLLREQFADMLRMLVRQYRGAPRGGAEEEEDAQRCLRAELDARAEAAALTVGTNSWETIFFSGIAANQPLLTFIIEGRPNGPAGGPVAPAPAAGVPADA